MDRIKYKVYLQTKDMSELFRIAMFTSVSKDEVKFSKKRYKKEKLHSNLLYSTLGSLEATLLISELERCTNNEDVTAPQILQALQETFKLYDLSSIEQREWFRAKFFMTLGELKCKALK